MARAADSAAVLAASAAWRSLRLQAAEELRSLVDLWTASSSKPRSLIARPQDYRPPELDTGRALLAGRLVLADAVLALGPGGDPWDTPSPSRAFAVELHRFVWLPSLTALGDSGEREALRLLLDWLGLFGRPEGFAWTAEVIERRVYNWACALPRVLARASETESGRLLASLARQTRWLSSLQPGSSRAAERWAVTAIAAGALEARIGGKLLARSLERLGPALAEAVLPDGGHRSRSPQRGLELLLDLRTLDDVLQQRGRSAPVDLSRSLDRLTASARFFTLGDGALAAFQGGEAVEPRRVSAARALEEDGSAPPPGFAPHVGYQRLSGRRLQIIADAAAPAAGDWSVEACAQLLALEATAGRDRLICSVGWSPGAAGPEFRTAAGGSTLTLDEGSPGAPLRDWRAGSLGPRLVGAPSSVEVRRNEDDGEHVWIELSHDGWVPRFGHRHERRLYLDAAADELRGEERILPATGRGRAAEYQLRFHLHPDVKGSVALDGRSVVLRPPTSGGWRLRHDAGSATLEPSLVYAGGLPRRSTQLVLRGQVLAEVGARVRWKLSPDTP